MGNYSATVVRISNLRPHSNADRLVCTNVFGNNVIVGKDTKIGDLGLYFPLESQLGEEFAKANDLIRRKDENGKAAGGMFDDNRRVRAQTFRGEKSMGFFIPVESLRSFTEFPYIEGDEIEKIKDYTISTKYIPRTNRVNTAGPKQGRKPRESKVIDGQFRFHFDTTQLGKNIHKIQPDDQIAITWKLHGTSAIVGNVLVKKPLSLLDRVARYLGVNIKDSHYEYLYASRRVVKNEFMEAKQHFYSYDLWTEVGKQFEGKLRSGETLYYEIVGFLKDGGVIQGGFDYKCERGTNKVYVYRITQTAPDGSVVELQWNQVKQRCKELDVDYVPEIFYGIAHEILPVTDWPEGVLPFLKENFVYDQDSQFCENKVPEEGICVRKEGLEIEVFKLKSFRFLEVETKALDANVVDIETEQTA